MKIPVYIDSHNIISPLGNTSEVNFKELQKGNTGVRLQTNYNLDENPFWASLIGVEQTHIISEIIGNPTGTSRFENLLIASISDALQDSGINIKSPRTIIIISTTKGNISLIEEPGFIKENLVELTLSHSAKVIGDYFGNPNKPIIISNACISGVVSILFAKRIIESGHYDNAIVAGADIISKFVFSGFKSFQALSPERCKPFCGDRNGINLGEAAGTLVLTNQTINIDGSPLLRVLDGAITNDSNHISGPSRTGIELGISINKAIKLSGISKKDVNFISAHGTATIYNDEMEAKAFNLCGLNTVPVNSLKSYFGHTLGAAGIVESIISILSLKKNILIPCLGFRSPGVIPSLNVIGELIEKEMNFFLKTASGFGGCNAAIIFSKSN